MSLGGRIQQLRKASGLSQEQLAEVVNVSRQAISKWETDQSTPEIDKILLLSKTFAISTDEMLGNDNTVNAQAPTSQLAAVIQANMKKRQFTLGWATVLAGIILLVIEFFSLSVIQFNAMKLELEHASGIGFNQNPMAYADIEPMPTIFKITIAIIIMGIGLIAFSVRRVKVS